ncbi:MAG: tRNA 2-selenouridine(34) synthase MnmH [Hydrogenovibrio sp.]|uniref:tRNA 2-selenouridine(34) synthase MnmH n=1 Tax=Hydrogenovibrio sp. TaxID=2065821 RepID=UPI00286FF98F|nr:tRNA 2-selenouridine(34) synthase MnmH [Hydrogenovibrio sp.]MDR9497722.1 tRNA 2-selenouridine(34) synthase MnmH [Hydrogenovibrio sp.]
MTERLLPTSDDFQSMVLNQTPLIDVRAPVEFAQGAFEHSVNLPLMNDEEREKVGRCYKQHGQTEAIRLGHELVNDAVRQPRIQAWQAFMQAHPQALLYCFRGGLRSKIAQQWLAEQGSSIVRVNGGYKAFRRYLFDYLQRLPETLAEQGTQVWVIAGRTGCGKTRLLDRLPHTVDLEGLAHHRGSAFGRHATPQPSQIDFENRLAAALIRQLHAFPGRLVVEDEAAHIGSVNLPHSVHQAFQAGERVRLETPLATRIENTFEEYVLQAQQEYPDLAAWTDFMRQAFFRIRKRLGGERYQRVMAAFDQAQQTQAQQGDPGGHRSWIEILLTEYYDPMYDYQMKKHPQTFRFQGDMDDLQAFMTSER